MKLTFIHDGPLFFDDKKNYYEFAYHKLYERYSYMADNITFMMRTKPISEERKFTKVPEQINIVSVPNFKDPKIYFKEKKRAAKIVEKQIKDSDITILRTQSSIAQLALKYIKKYNIPYIIESVGCSWDSYWNHGIIGKIIAPYMFYKTKEAIKNANYVYYVTDEFLQKRYPTKGKTVSCSNVVLDKVDDNILVQRIKKIKTLNPEKKLILGTAAALDTRYKGQEHIICIIEKLVERGYNVEYHLAGGMTSTKGNTFLADLAKKHNVEKRVVFCGSLSAEQMLQYYDSLDIYIQPSKQEGLPRAVIEAMSRGCPVIGTNIAGIPELIRNECLFKKNSDIEAYNKICEVLRMDLTAIAKENFYHARSFESEKLEDKRKKFYDEFMKDNRLRLKEEKN